MKRFITYICIISAALAFASCKKNVIATSEGEGSLVLGVKIQQTKAAMSTDELTASAKVNIYKGDFSGLVRSYVYADAPSTIYLPADDYRVDVIAGEAAKATPAIASWEQKSYAGSKDFSITAGNVQNVQVEAKISSVVTMVTFDSSIAENLNDGYIFKIGFSEDGTDDVLEYNASKSGSEGYFLPIGFEPSLYWSFSGVRSKDGSTISKTGEIPAVEGGKMYKLTPKFTIKDGDAELQVFVDYSTIEISDVIIFEPVSTGISASNKYEIWAAHATVHADVDEGEYNDPSKIGFAYRAAGGEWTYVSATRVEEGVYDATLTGLTPSTQYEYKLVIDGEDMGEAATFTTEDAPVIPNGGLEVYSNTGNYKSFYDPNHALWNQKWWDSGNEGSTSVGSSGIICEPDTSDKMEGNASAKLSSKYVVIKFAAGNLFCGEFAGLVGTQGGKVNFGRPFTGRPTALRFWLKYQGGVINRGDNSAPVKQGDYDLGSITVALGTWNFKTYGGTPTSPVQVNTTDKSTFRDYAVLPETIAYAFHDEQSSADYTTEWKQITLPLTYKNTMATPSTIIINCASSKYGDYFVGYDEARMWLDGFELLYE